MRIGPASFILPWACRPRRSAHGLAGRDHHPALGVADGRVREAGRLHETAVPAWHEVGLQRRGTELAGRMHHAGLRSGPGRVDVPAGLHAAGHRPLGSDLAHQRVPAGHNRRGGTARVRFGHTCQCGCHGENRLFDAASGPVERQEILTSQYVRLASQTPPGQDTLPVLHPETYGAAAAHYGLLWWNNADRTLQGVPGDAYWSWGLYDSLIVVIPSLDVVVARARPIVGPPRGSGPLRRAGVFLSADCGIGQRRRARKHVRHPRPRSEI